MAAALFLVLMVYTHHSSGCLDEAELQPIEITVQRGTSLKLNCSFNASFQGKKPSLTWIKRAPNRQEVIVYPAQGASDKARFHVEPGAFKSQEDAGLIMKNLRGRDSGFYLCRITILEDGGTKECNIEGYYLIVQGTFFDTFIACCPLGVFIAALLVLHGMVYKQWQKYKKGRDSPAEKRTKKTIPKFFSDLSEFFSNL